MMTRLIALSVLLLSLTPGWANTPATQIQQLLHATHTAPTRPADTALLHDLQTNYRFVVFFESTCPHCHKLIPVLKDFAQYYGVPLEGYSVDGADLDHLHAKKMTAQQYKDYFLQGGFKAAVPAVFLQNRQTGQTYAVLFGEAQPYQLAKRVNQLMTHIREQAHA